MGGSCVSRGASPRRVTGPFALSAAMSQGKNAPRDAMSPSALEQAGTVGQASASSAPSPVAGGASIADSDDAGHGFRLKPATYSDRSRPG